jgi:hypothetical protein
MIGMNTYSQFYFHIEPPTKFILACVWTTLIIAYITPITIQT